MDLDGQAAGPEFQDVLSFSITHYSRLDLPQVGRVDAQSSNRLVIPGPRAEDAGAVALTRLYESLNSRAGGVLLRLLAAASRLGVYLSLGLLVIVLAGWRGAFDFYGCLHGSRGSECGGPIHPHLFVLVPIAAAVTVLVSGLVGELWARRQRTKQRMS